MRVVAHNAHNADDLRDLLAMLGLDAAESRPAERPAPAMPVQRHRGMPMSDLTAMLAAADVHHRRR